MATFEHLSTSNIIPAGSRPSGATENHIFGDATINDIPMNNGDVNGTPKRSVSSIFDTSGNDPPVRPARRQFSNRNRGDTTAIQKEREERVRRLREQQEDERRKKLEELRQHALAAQKFREQQEYERRRHLEELRYRDEDKRSQVEERRRAIEAVERERREALLKKNQEREERLEIKRRQQGSQINFAFGSSTPRILGSRVDSTNEVWKGTMRSNSTSNVTNQLMTQSLYSRRSSERDQIDFTTTPNPKKTKRAISAQGLNKSGEGEPRLSVLDRQSTFSGTPSTVQAARRSRARSETRTYGFGSAMGRFTAVHSQPTSPMIEKPLAWYVKDIDIGDGGGGGGVSSTSQQPVEPDLFGHRPMRRRSRHETHFQLGSHVPIGEENLMSQSMHLAPSYSAHRKRHPDLMPTITASANSNVGSRTPSRATGDHSRSSTPGHKMIRSATTGRVQSMSRLDLVSRPRVLNSPHASKVTAASIPPATRNRSRVGRTSSSDETPPVKSVSMIQLNGTASDEGRKSNKEVRTKSVAVNIGLSTPNQRPPSAASNDPGSGRPGPAGGVRLRDSPHPRKPRPFSIATTGIMSSSMYEKGSKFGAMTPKLGSNSQKLSSLDGRGNRNVDDDSISNSSKTSSTQNKPRRTPAQVKAHSKAKKSPVTGTPTKTPTTPVKSPKVEAQPVLEPDLNNVSETNETQAVPANSEAAPDVISNTTAVKDNEEDKPEEPKEVATVDDDGNNNRNDDQQSQGVGVKSSPEPEKSILPDNDIDSEPAGSKKNIITTEDEAKARFAEKRREAKEIERQKLLAIQREEEERRLREEEEARLLQEEADRIAQEARRIEDERLQRAIEKNEQREREQKEREERFRREKEEAAKRAKEEEEKKRIEREEKLRKEEEERNERKRRIAEIRARTGLGKTSTVTPPKVTENNTEAKESNSDANVANTDRSNGNEQLMDPIKPDLLGDIADKTIKIPTSDIEKGLLDMQISAKDENEKNKQINSSKFDSLNFKHPDEKSMLGDNDRDDTEQIIDFSVNSSTNGHDVEVENRTSPISAFGENHVEISPADLLS